MDLGASGRQRQRATLRAGKPEHLMSGADQVRNDRGADETGRAGDEHTHRLVPWISMATTVH